MKTATATTSFQEYAALPRVNWSSLKHLTISPKEYRYRTTPDAPDTDSKAMRMGRALHALLPTREEYDSDWIVYTDTLSRRGKAWDAFKAKHEGREILTVSEAETAEAMADAVRHDPLASKYLEHGERERVATWADAHTGLGCKGRTDLLNGRLVEFKSCAAQYLPPSAFYPHAARLGYHGQLAFYLDGLAASGYELTHEPVMIVVQSSPPWDVVVYDDISETFIEEGRVLYRHLLDTLRPAMANNEWPGVAPSGRASLHLPAWAIRSGGTITLDGEEVF